MQIRSQSVRVGRTCLAGALTCSRLIKLRLAYILCYFIRKRRCSYIVCIGFTNAEYRIALVDFIVALRRTKGRGRRTLRSPPSPSSGLHLIHPGVSAAAGHYCCRGFIPIQVTVFRCKSLIPSSEFCSAFCVRAMVVRVSVGLLGWYRTFFIIGGGDRSCLRLRGVFAMFFRRICADRDWVVCFIW